MTDPQVSGQGPPAASVPSASGPMASTDGPVTDHEPATAQAPASVPPRGRRRWPLITLVAVVVVAALAGGLLAWAPWTQPPVLRPAGLAAGPATANSISFHWARPATGPLPDKYLILSDGRAAGTVAGTVTSYRQAGLTPASSYQYSVVALRGGKRSPRSAALAVSTITPPMSQGRLQGLWTVYAKTIRHTSHGRSGTMYWNFIPSCATGPCAVVAHAKVGKYSFKVTLTPAGGVYRGQTVANLGPCGPRSGSVSDPATVKFRIRVTNAVGEGQEWNAISLRGTMAGSYKFVSGATFYCPASSFKAALSGNPS